MTLPEHKTAEIDYFYNEQGDYTVSVNGEPFCASKIEREAQWIVREFKIILQKEREEYAESQTQQLRTEVAHFIEVNDSNQKVVNLLQEENTRLREALEGVVRIEHLIGYADPMLASHLGEYEAIEAMLTNVKSVLTPKP